ncbi:hypothetical protein BDV06DRAFT_221700 [Aspergillus oleicola]
MTTSALGTAVLAVAWIFAGLATTVVAIRYYVRVKIIRRLTVDDGLIFLTLAFEIGNSIFLTVSTHWGLGLHLDALSDEQVMHSVKWVYLCEFFSILSPCVGRIAYASLLLSLLPPIPWRSRLLWTIIWIQIVVDCGTVIIRFAQSATDDLTNAMAHLSIWWTLEANLVILAASIPTLRPIVAAPRHPQSAGAHKQHAWKRRLDAIFRCGHENTSEQTGRSFELLNGTSQDGTTSSPGTYLYRCIMEQSENHRKGAIEKTTTIGIMCGNTTETEPVRQFE